MIDRYAQDGWIFLAAEVRKDSDRPFPPHPLKAVFETDKLVYPMRLTGIQDTPLFLELLVVADRQAKVEGLEAWSCDNRDLVVLVEKDKDDKDVYADWVGSGRYAMAKNGQVATYLRGELHPSKMQKDFQVEWKPYERFRAEVYDQEQAKQKAVLTGTFWLPVAAFVLGFWPLLRGFRSVRAIWAAAGSLAISIGFALSWYSGVKKVETEGFESSPWDGPVGSGYK